MIRQPKIEIVDLPDGRHQLRVNDYSVAIFPLGPVAQSNPMGYAKFVAEVLKRALLQESRVLCPTCQGTGITYDANSLQTQANGCYCPCAFGKALMDLESKTL